MVAAAVGAQYQSLGLWRKWALFGREAAVLYHRLYNLRAAHGLLRAVAPHYQLQGVGGVGEVKQPKRGWLVLQRMVLKDLIAIAQSLDGTCSREKCENNS